MIGKPHFYMKHGYWNCRCDGLHGAGYTKKSAFESMIRVKRFWTRELGLSYDG